MSDSQNSGDLLDAPRDLDIDSLTRSAFKSFSLIEPWYLAERRFKHPLVFAMVDKIIRQADVYFSAVADSVNSVNDGWTLASDAVSLCDYLASDKHSIQELESFRGSMLDTAASAQRRTQSTVEAFRKVRQGLMQISNDIPNDLITIQEEVVNSADLNNNFVALPASLPQEVLVETVTVKGRLPDNSRAMEAHTAMEIKAQLEQAVNDLGRLIEHVSDFADWWTSVRFGLISLQATLPQLVGNSNPLRTSSARARWATIQQEYLLYSRRIALLEDYYPMLVQRRKRTRPASNQKIRSGPSAAPDSSLAKRRQTLPTRLPSYTLNRPLPSLPLQPTNNRRKMAAMSRSLYGVPAKRAARRVTKSPEKTMIPQFRRRNSEGSRGDVCCIIC